MPLDIAQVHGCVIKDDDHFRYAIDVYKRLGILPGNISFARNRPDARELIEGSIREHRAIHIALVDPGLDPGVPDVWEGIDCIREIRENHPESYILCMSTSGDPHHRRQELAIEAGANDFLSTAWPGNWIDNMQHKFEEGLTRLLAQ